jgi:hypothetical protein
MISITADGRLLKKHARLYASGKRPPYLIECYTMLQHLEQEANSLSAMGYRIQSRQDTRASSGYFYNVTFAYAPEMDLVAARGHSPATSQTYGAPSKSGLWGKRIAITLAVIVVLFIGLAVLGAMLSPTHATPKYHKKIAASSFPPHIALAIPIAYDTSAFRLNR